MTRDWFDHTAAARRIEVAEMAMSGRPESVEREMSPDADTGHVERHAKLQRTRLLFTSRQPQGYYHYGEPRTVASRLPIWC